MPNVGDFGFCQATVYRQGKHSFSPCGKPGVYIEEIYEMSQPGHAGVRIRCVCANCGAESTHSCIKCRIILHDWSIKHIESECHLNTIKAVINS